MIIIWLVLSLKMVKISIIIVDLFRSVKKT